MEEIYEDSGMMLYRDALIAYIDSYQVDDITELIEQLNEEHNTAITVSPMGEVTARTQDEIKILKREMIKNPHLYRLK